MEKISSNEKEAQQLKNRFHDLADKAFMQGIYTFTGFLGLGEQDVFWQEEPKLRYAGYMAEGGRKDADRVMIRFGNPEELGYEAPFPIVCVHISPLAKKFADELSHRDFLGALMNLGIDRSTLGDIRVGEKEAWLYCGDSVAEFIRDNLKQVKRTSVSCAVTEAAEELPEEEPESVNVHIQSLRADALIAKIYNMSREKSRELFRAGKVYVNGRLCEDNSRQLKREETVSVRGYGKFILAGEPRETKKGRLTAEISVYR